LTSKNFCGTLGRNVVLMEPISGRLRAAAMNLSRLAVRKGTSRPRGLQARTEIRRKCRLQELPGRKAESGSLREFAELLIQALLNFLKLFRSCFRDRSIVSK